MAMEVVIGALQVLRCTSEAREVREQRLEPHIRPRGGAGAVQPLPPETPQLLPMVHLSWGPLLAAIKVRACNHHLLLVKVTSLLTIAA